MKKTILWISLSCILIITSICAFAQQGCTVNGNGDMTCPDPNNPNVTYTTPSPATLASEAAIQANVEANQISQQQQQTLIAQDEQALAISDLQSKGLLSPSQASSAMPKLKAITNSVGS